MTAGLGVTAVESCYRNRNIILAVYLQMAKAEDGQLSRGAANCGRSTKYLQVRCAASAAIHRMSLGGK